MYESFLRKIPLFADLPDDDLTSLCDMIHEVRLDAGETLFNEGDTADMAYITFDGELEVTKLVDGRDIHIDTHRAPGIVIGESALLEESMRLATVRAVKPSFLLGLSRFQVQELLNKSPSAAQIMFKTLTNRSRNLEAHVRHDQRMAQLGTMTAGLAHELNNPASAVLGSANRLAEAQERSEAARLALERFDFSAEQQAGIKTLMELVRNRAAAPAILDVLERSDREAELEQWLDTAAIPESWTLTASLVALGLDTADLDQLAAQFPAPRLAALLHWLAAAYTSRSLLVEINREAGRIVELVNALKSYVYLDQGPVQNVDIHAGLEDTLRVLGSRIPAGVTIRREYAPNLPRVTAFGSDLNQVWTNLLENALDALNGQGEIVIRTWQDGRYVVVSIEDNGPGIPPEHLPQLFGPFFTTKPPGSGAGLGLTICYSIISNHHGEIEVTSQPGQTTVHVRLPT